VGKASAGLPIQKRKVLPQDSLKKACTMTVAIIDDVNSTYSYIEEQISSTSSSLTPSPLQRKCRERKVQTTFTRKAY
jgi:hypothetical protein